MNPLAVAGATVAGAVLGLGSGWLAVALERVERLRQEEDEERLEYERDVASQREHAVAEGRSAPDAAPWVGERYGWTWLERILAPAATALGFAVFTAHGPLSAGLLIRLAWLLVFVHVVVFDLKHRLILNKITYPAIVVALGVAQVSPGLTFTRALAGCVVVALFFGIMSLVSRGGIGLGDAKLGALIGAVTGLSTDPGHLGAAYAVIYGILLGGAISLLLLIARLRGLRDHIPYGPFLCAGAAIILYQGP